VLWKQVFSLRYKEVVAVSFRRDACDHGRAAYYVWRIRKKGLEAKGAYLSPWPSSALAAG
jgi:hypothetical protein